LSSNLIAIIPARGGSKRLPGKNVRPFFGHPMLAYSVSAALNSGLFAKVIISSDDPAIGRIAEWYGATFMLRPPELANDTAQLVDVARYILDVLRSRGIEPEAICQCMPNCPLVRSEDIVEHWRVFNDNDRERLFQISAIPYRGVYPQWAVIADDQRIGRWLFGERSLVRSQDLQPTFCPTGAIWWARTKDFLEQNAFYGSPFHLAPMDANRGVDIDDEEDLKLAELLVHGLTVRDGVSPLEPVNHNTYVLGSLSA
jgi:CMP-N-acetylneuraminic acid synthetase